MIRKKRLRHLRNGSRRLRGHRAHQRPGRHARRAFRGSGAAIGVDPFPAGLFAGACFAPNVAQATLGTLVSRNDSDIPAPDTSFMYQVSHSSQAAGAINPLGVRPAPGPHAGQLVMAGAACL